MNSLQKYTVFIYFVLLGIVFLFFCSFAHAEEDPTASINIIDTGINGLQTIEMVCRGQTYSTTVSQARLASALKNLEAWVDDKCNQGENK